MRHLGVGLAIVLLAGSAAAADVYRTRVTGFGITITFHAISDDACVETSGELAAVSTSEGTVGFVTAVRTDYCAEGGPVDWFYAWIEPVAFTANGMTSSTLTGSFAMTPYAGTAEGGDVTLDFALAFSGSGPVSVTTSRFRSTSPDDTTLFFSVARSRAATASGSLSIGGDGGAVTSAQLVGGTEGELVVIH
jgi:hypothetical protein